MPNRYIRLICCLAFITSVSGCGSPKPHPGDTTPPTSRGHAGCYSASYGEAQGYGTIGLTLGNAYYDMKMNQEVSIQRAFYNGVPAAVYILNEGGLQYRNCYATQDGYILMGYHMHYYAVQFSELAVAGLLAHEWGHRCQFVNGWQAQAPIQELEADAFSGYYMGLAKQWAWSQIQGYYANVYAIGDYNFNSPQHHGTPNQRVASAYLGVNTAIQVISTSKPLSYNELHSVFTQEIINRILLTKGRDHEMGLSDKALENALSNVDLESIADGRSLGKEVVYPKKLSQLEVMGLAPHN